MNETETPKKSAVTYPGNCQDVVGNVIGPNSFGEYYQAVAATYDHERNKTRVELKQVRDPRGDGVQWWDRDLAPIEDRGGVQL